MDLNRPMHAVISTTKFASSIRARAEVYSIQL